MSDPNVREQIGPPQINMQRMMQYTESWEDLNPEPQKTQSQTYRGTSLIRDSGRLGPYSSTMPRALWQS